MSVAIPLLFGDSSSIHSLGPEFRLQQRESRDQGLIDPIFKTNVNNPLNFKTEFTVFDAKNSTEPSPENEDMDISQVFAMQDLSNRKRPSTVQEMMIYQVEDENLDPGFTRQMQIAMEDEPTRDFVDLVRESRASARAEDNIYGQPPKLKTFSEELQELKRAIEDKSDPSKVSQALDFIKTQGKAFITQEATKEGKRIARGKLRELVNAFLASTPAEAAKLAAGDVVSEIRDAIGV